MDRQDENSLKVMFIPLELEWKTIVYYHDSRNQRNYLKQTVAGSTYLIFISYSCFMSNIARWSIFDIDLNLARGIDFLSTNRWFAFDKKLGDNLDKGAPLTSSIAVTRIQWDESRIYVWKAEIPIFLFNVYNFCVWILWRWSMQIDEESVSEMYFHPATSRWVFKYMSKNIVLNIIFHSGRLQ